MDSETEKMFISVVTEVTFLASSKDWNAEFASLFTQLVSVIINDGVSDWSKIKKVVKKIYSLNHKMEFLSLTDQIHNLMRYGDLDSEWEVVLSLVTQIIFLVRFIDLDSESDLVSRIKKIISLFNSKPDSESELVSLITQTMRFGFSTKEHELMSLIVQLVSLKKTELESLIRQIISRFRNMNWEPLRFISFCPQVEVSLEQGKFCVLIEDVQPREAKKGKCRFDSVRFKRSTTENYFYCGDCNGKNHEEYDKASVEVKHLLHPKHSLRPVLLNQMSGTRECYCCDKDVDKMFYYCSACDFAMNLECLKKPPPVLSIDHPKWHEHTLVLFPSQAPLTCNLCAITHSSCPFYVCPPCDFVVHQKCLSLPHVIRISRHVHRISFTSCFDQGDRFCCGVCRKKIDNDYGGYSCIKDGCSFVAHSRCATQTNVWDGKELEGVLEETEEEEEEVEPFVRISDGIIQHFSHQQHYLKLDENKGRDYDDNKMCQACITPIYFGNFYSCMECEFILHDKCANLSRKIYYPMHPHRLTLVGGYQGIEEYLGGYCSACYSMCIGGFFYQCGKKECHRLEFKLHVQCATISEPLVHESHMHPLYLTSKPEERRECSVCKIGRTETFNCVEGECDISLCFRCAIIPQKVRYKHDKHVLTLCYGEETSTMTYWCEVCEEKVNSKERFYKCDEYCCVTLHVECLIGNELYMKPGSSFLFRNRKVCFLPNNQHMSRPFCSYCKKRSPFRLAIQYSELMFCSMNCVMLY